MFGFTGSPGSYSAKGNVAWTQASWYLDPSNTTGHASDANAGTSSGAPLLTWAEVLRRYGTIAPVLQQDTTFFFLSDSPDLTDPVIFAPVRTRGASVGIQGSLVNVGTSGTLGAVVAKNRATAQLLTANLGTPVAALVGMLLENTTRTARCWIDAVGSGANVAVLTQPLPSCTTTLPTKPSFSGAEVDTFALGDAFVVKRPVKVNLALWKPTDNYDIDAGFDFLYSFLQQVWGIDVGPGDSIFATSPDTSAVECRFDRFTQVQDTGVVSGVYDNCWSNGSGAYTNITLNGGAVNTALSFSVGVSKSTLDGDVVVHGLCEQGSDSAEPSYCGLAYFDGNLLVRYGSAMRITPEVFASAIVWGPGTIEVAAGGRLLYDTSATANLVATALKIDGTTNGNAFTRATGAWAAQTSVTAAHLDAADGKALANPQTGSCFAQYVS